MEADILDFKIKVNRKHIGCLLISYHELILNCLLVYHPGDKKAWIKMPEVWFTSDKKTNFCYWKTNEISDQFQKCILKKLIEIYNLDLEKIAELHGSLKENKKLN